jgi:hypothetical protein
MRCTPGDAGRRACRELITGERPNAGGLANAVVKCRAFEHDEANGQQGCSPDDQRLPGLRQEQRQCFQVAGEFSADFYKPKRFGNPDQQSRREQYQENFGKPRSELATLHVCPQLSRTQMTYCRVSP